MLDLWRRHIAWRLMRTSTFEARHVPRAKLNATTAKAYRKRRKRDEGSGLCTMCRKAQATPGRPSCADCRAKHSAYVNARRQRLEDAGLCTKCGKQPPMRGFKRCMVCRAVVRMDGRKRYHRNKRRMAPPE